MNTARIGLPLLGAALAAALWPAPAAAASLDQGLLGSAEPILTALKAANVRSVGVLPFEIRKGKRDLSYDAPLAVGIAPRLENALVLRQASGAKSPFLILRESGANAGRNKAAAWRTDEKAFKRLFQMEQKPAWGVVNAKAEGFLVGTISSTGDRKETKVTVSLVVPSSWKFGKLQPKEIHSFKVKTDRSLLRDLGYTVAVPVARAINKDVSSDDLDSSAIDTVVDEENGKEKNDVPPADRPPPHTPENVAGIRLEIEYDGKVQEITALPSSEGSQQASYQVVAAKPGQKVVIWLTRVSDGGEKLGAVLRVNGKSVYNEEDGEPIQCKKWVYDATKKDKRDDFEGFYGRDDKGELTVRPFKVLTQEEATERAGELGSRAGWIDLEVFTTRTVDEPVDESGPTFSMRSVPRARAMSLRSARTALARANRLALSKVTSRSIEGVMLGEVDPVPAGPVKMDKLPNPVRLGGISIRYVDAK